MPEKQRGRGGIPIMWLLWLLVTEVTWSKAPNRKYTSGAFHDRLVTVLGVHAQHSIWFTYTHMRRLGVQPMGGGLKALLLGHSFQQKSYKIICAFKSFCACCLSVKAYHVKISKKPETASGSGFHHLECNISRVRAVFMRHSIHSPSLLPPQQLHIGLWRKGQRSWASPNSN